jgi:hypothetical protein
VPLEWTHNLFKHRYGPCQHRPILCATREPSRIGGERQRLDPVQVDSTWQMSPWLPPVIGLVSSATMVLVRSWVGSNRLHKINSTRDDESILRHGGTYQQRAFLLKRLSNYWLAKSSIQRELTPRLCESAICINLLRTNANRKVCSRRTELL